MTNVKKILVAEDDQPLAKALKLKLERSGFNVVIATNGEEAMEAMIKDGFSLLLLDLMMPKKDGFTVIKEMKEKKIKTPVIILSNLGQEADMEKANGLGVSGYFVKSDTPIAEIVLHAKEVLDGQK